MKVSMFSIGQLVRHKTQGYSAVIVDIDLNFQPSGQPNPRIIPEKMERKGPWYRLLVHKSTLITYVEEAELEQTFIHGTVVHPKLYDYLEHKRGSLTLKRPLH